MTQNTNEVHWRDRAISGLSVISDGFEVFKAAGAHVAEWVLWFCLVANLLEMFPLPLPSWYGVTVIAIQSVMLDVAGFGLTSMAASAKRRGDLDAAKKGGRMGMALIIIMMLTVGLITLSVLVPVTKPYVDWTDKLMILARMVVTVFYGHIVDEMKKAGVSHDNRLADMEQELTDMRGQLAAKVQEVSTVQSQLSTVQGRVSTLEVELDTTQRSLSTVQHKLDAEQQRANGLEQELLTGQGDTSGLRRELSGVNIELEGLRGRLAAKAREVEEMQADLSNVVALRRELNAAQMASQELRAQLDGKTRELQGVQLQLSTEQRTVSSLRRELSTGQPQQVSSGQGERVSSGQKNGGSGQVRQGDTGQQKVVQLDSRRVNPREYALAVQQLMAEEKLAGREISGREISRRLGGSPTTANEWKKFFDEGKKLEDVFPDLRVVNE